ncbi:MAG: sugar ABC transporter ATP-binding protein [Sedimentisphaerales bacterium]|nr:sugar ABC transporter ATP-binding protein [Sedimentisphaerales bacterium]
MDPVTNASSETVALRMTGISKRFGPVQALLDVNLTVRTGTVHALVGENGAGKSTLMKILAGVHQPDGGAIEIRGNVRAFQRPAEALAAGISMIYQELDLAEDLTVAANVFLGMEPRGKLPCTVDHRQAERRTAELARQYDFDIDANAVVGDLSTGDCQIVEILKALMRHSSIIVMDEPTSSLSESEATRLFEVVRALRRRGITIIYISHRLEEIVDLADEISILRDGQLVHTDVMARLDIPQIVHHMVGRQLKDFFPARDVTPGETLVSVRDLASDNGVRQATFEIRRGEIVGMAGLVGAGRTQVARALFGLDPKTSGTVVLEGRSLRIETPAQAIAERIAYLTEDRKRTGLCLGLACSWNITLPNLEAIGMKHWIRPARETRIVEQIAQRVSMRWAGPQMPVDSLSGGNQQKVLIARWVLAESKFLIFDEPTRGIDVGAKKEVYTLLNQLAEQGKAILFISSELPELLGMTDRILVMRRGRLVGDLVTKDTDQEQVMHLAAVESN